MKQGKKILIPVVFFVFALFLNATSCFAQFDCGTPTDPNCDPGDYNCFCGCFPSDPHCPIDSGVWYLLAAGVGYGVIVARKAHKKSMVA